MTPFGFINDIGTYPQRAVARDEVDGGIVDTAAVSDSSQPYETGIRHPSYNDNNWVIVELYSTKLRAVNGHARWVKIMEQKPASLIDVSETGLESLAQVIGHTLRGTFPRKEREDEASH